MGRTKNRPVTMVMGAVFIMRYVYFNIPLMYFVHAARGGLSDRTLPGARSKGVERLYITSCSQQGGRVIAHYLVLATRGG